MPPTKRKAANALDPSERKRAQNRISQQCLREKNITYIRNLEETIDLLQKVATGSDPQDRYSVLLDAHLKLIAENRKLEDALLRLRKKLLSFGQAANAAAGERDAENPEAQQPAPSTELANHETPSALDPSINNQTFQDTQEQTNPQTDIFKDASFLLDLSMPGQEHEALTSSTMQPGDTFIDPAISSLPPRSLLFVPNQLSITSMSIFGSRLLGACRRHLDNLHDCGTNAEMVDKIVKTAVRFSMRCVGLESYAYGVNGAKYIERVISWRLGIDSKNSVPLPFRPTPLQSKNPTHFWGIDLFNWPEIRDQLVLDAESTDFDELLRDLVLHSVIEPANHSVAVNILDIFENQVLRRRQNQKTPPRSYFTDPSWTLFQIGPEVGEWYSSEHDIVEEAIFQELDRQINAVAPSPDDNPVEESQANDIAKFLGLDDFFGLLDSQSSNFGNMACCAVGAYIVFHFLNIHEKLCALYPRQSYVDHAPTQRPKPVKGAQVRILSLDGLTCASCVSDVQDIIKTIPGVLKATVSLGLLRAQVEFNNHLVTEGEIIDAIRSAGYDAHSLPSSDSQSWASLLSMIQEPTNSQQHHVNSCQRDFLVATAASVLFLASRSIIGLWTTQNSYINLIAYIAVAMSLLAGSQLHFEALRSAWHGQRPNMATLASLGIMLALIQAVADSLQTGINRSYRMDFKSLEVIPILSTSVLGGRLLKTILSRRDRVFASPLSSLVPAMAMVCNKTDEHASIPIDLLSPCDSVIVRQGEHIPCDGVVESTASALILETWINGSLEPRTVKRNDAVYAGGQVQQGSLACRTTACGRSTRLGELLTSVVTAELANSEPQLHRATSWFSSAVILLAITLLTVYPVFVNETCWIDGVGRASALLLAACPCSLSLSIPTCKLLATVEASKFGVRLLTTYARLRSAASAQTIFFDKTGTLTHGDLKVIHASFSKEWETLEKQEILWRAVHKVEAGITHPVARALFQESYSKLGEKPGYLSTILVSEIKYELGRGAQAVVTATQPGSESTTWKLAIGSRTYIESPGVSVDLSQTPVKMRTGVTTTVVLAMDGKQAAVFALEDTVRSDAQKVISQLKDLGLTIGMITGDNAASATAVARELGIDSDMIFANALPEEKSCILARFLQRGPAIYVGDNYNDLLCFASASFSICVASSEMQSIDSDCADGTLMISEASPLSRIPLMILLARRMRCIVTQNHCWAVVYNILSVACALGVGWIPPPSP
ncbi:haloacid dehalogenase-like hydrolase-domain-containing protein [Fusarium oxysporum f. sp. albedinis]|nr:haloacid dehalogenase-like hydrolase-domain-containing protein [Fusarium oxysporum f. sp. albedinis]